MGRPSTQTERDPFGKRLLQLRENAGLTQEALAAASGINQSRIAQIERNGLQNIDLVSTLARSLNISTDELLGFENAKRHRRGPKGELETILEELSKLPRTRQKIAIQFLRAWIRDAQGK